MKNSIINAHLYSRFAESWQAIIKDFCDKTLIKLASELLYSS